MLYHQDLVVDSVCACLFFVGLGIIGSGGGVEGIRRLWVCAVLLNQTEM